MNYLRHQFPFLPYYNIASPFSYARLVKLVKMARSTYVEALLGAETFAKVRNTKILVVGAGGIGCELREPLSLLSSRRH
jgi:hypothetical protein